MLANIIEHARNGVVTRQAEIVDHRSWWDRRKDTMAEATLSIGILCNTVLLGVSADYNPDWAGWVAIDACFAVFFLAAMLVKIHAVGWHRYTRGECKYWNYFEMVIVALGLVEVLILVLTRLFEGFDAGINLNVVRLLRMSRIGRLAGVCRQGWVAYFSDLSMMIHGAVGGMKTLIWAMLLISLPMYAMAVMLRDSLGDDQSEGGQAFRSVSVAFFTVFRCLVAGDCTTEGGRPVFVLVSATHGWFLAVIYCLVTMLMTFGFYNVIMAIYIENILAAAKFNGHHQKRQRLLDATYFADKVTRLVEFVWRLHSTWKRQEGSELDETDETVGFNTVNMDEVASIEITPEFFDLLRSFKDFQDILCDLDIADEDQLDLFDTLDVDGGGTIDLEELVVGICKLRGDARRSDIVGVSLVARSTQKSLAQFSEHIVEVLEANANTMNHMRRSVKEVVSNLKEAKESIEEISSRPRSSFCISRRPSLAVELPPLADGSRRPSLEALVTHCVSNSSFNSAKPSILQPKAKEEDL